MLMQTMPMPSAAGSESDPFDAGEDAILACAACADVRHSRRVPAAPPARMA
jgi:hypothetical protein